MDTQPVDPLFGERTRSIVPAAIAQKRVLILGLGSLGGLVARSLAQCGVTQFTLIDLDLFGVENICRHVLDHRDVGRPKVEAMADHLRHINPAVEVAVHQFDVLTDRLRFEALLREQDAAAGCTDDFQAHLMLNEASLLHGITTTYGTVFDRGEGGKVVIVEPGGKLGCLYCSEGMNGSVYKKKEPLEARYGVTAPWVALSPFVGSIALEQAWMTLWALACDIPGHAMLKPPAPYIATTFVDLFDDDGALVAKANRNYFDFPPIQPGCLACQIAGRTPRIARFDRPPVEVDIPEDMLVRLPFVE